jgi:signal transduction histidine kinase
VLGARESELLGTLTTALDQDGACGDAWDQREFVGHDGRRRIVARRRSQIPTTEARPREATLGTVEILDDRTQVTELSERLHALDKLAALGNMAGGIAHELRNPMMAVQGFGAMLCGKLPAESDERRWAALIVEGATEANSILTSMMSLATPEKLVLSTVDAEELVRASERLATQDFEERARWNVRCTHDCPPFAGDRIKLRQALRNLIANALQAQPAGGAVQVALERDGDEIVARVSDAGPGIPRAALKRVLEPFFTTRAEGTGLGLALVQRIAELHGGRVDVSAQPSCLGGAEVSLRIPYRSPQN